MHEMKAAASSKGWSRPAKQLKAVSNIAIGYPKPAKQARGSEGKKGFGERN